MKRVLYPLAVAVGVILIYWKFSLSKQFTWLDGPDHVNQVYPWLQMQAREWHRGHFPIIDPNHFAGNAFLAQNQPGSLHPLNWLLFVLPLKHGRLQIPILNGYYVLMHLIGAWAMYWLARGLRITPWSAVVVGLGFGCGGFMAEIQWPQMLNGVGYVPLVLLLWIRYLRAPGRAEVAASAGAITALISFAGHHSAPEMTLVMVAVISAGWIVSRWRRMHWPRLKRLAGGLAAFAVFFGAGSAALSLPAFEYWRVALRWINAAQPVKWSDPIPFLTHRVYSLGPESLLGFVIPGFHADAPLSPYIGVSVVTLAVIGFLARRGIVTYLMTTLAAAGVLLALGDSSLLHGLFFALFPLFDKMRMPSMFSLLTQLALLVLAGFGIDALRSGFMAPRRLGHVLLVAAGLGFYGVAIANVTAKEALHRVDPVAWFALCAGAFGVTLLVQSRAASKAAIAALLVVFEVGSTATRSYKDKEMKWELFEHLTLYDDIAGFLLKQKEHEPPFRVSAVDELQPTHFGLLYGIEQSDGGCCGALPNVLRALWLEPVKRLYGARFHIGPAPRNPGDVSRFEGKSGWKVWETQEYAPRVWTAHKFQIVTDDAMHAEYEKGWPHMRETVSAVRGSANVEQCAQVDEMTLTNLRAEYVSVEGRMGCAGLLVLSNSVLPGWEIYVDGAPSTQIDAYDKFLATVVPKGEHKVEFVYAARTFKRGVALTLTSFAALGVWWWLRLSGRLGSGFRGRRRQAAT